MLCLRGGGRSLCRLASILDQTGQTQETAEHTRRGVQIDGANGFCQLQSAFNTANQGDIQEAINISQKLIDAEPENALAYDIRLRCAQALRRNDEAMAVARDALTVSPFDGDLHYRLGRTAGEVGNFETAVPHFAYALLLQPSRTEIESQMRLALGFVLKTPNAPEQLVAIAASVPQFPLLLDELAWIFATNPNPAVRNGPEAFRLSQEAVAASNRPGAALLVTLAAAYGEIGRFADGTAVAEQALSIATVAGDASTSALAESVLNSLKSRQAYREEHAP